MQQHAVSVAVVPFLNLSRDVDQDYFTRGFVDDLITELSRYSTLEIVGGPALFGDDLADRPSVEVARELGASFVLQGSVRKNDDSLRVNGQLVDVENGRHRWAETFAAPLERVLAVQDEIVASVAGALAVRIDEARLTRARRMPLGGLAAYDCWLRGIDCLRRGSLEADEEGRSFFRRALEIDPRYARAWAGLSLSYFNDWSCQAWHVFDESGEGAFDCARRAVEIDDGDPIVHLVLGRIRLFKRDFEAARRDLERALALNPNNPDLLALLAPPFAFIGEPERAVELADKARRLNPRHPPYYYYGSILALCLLRRFEEVLPLGELIGPITVDIPLYLATAAAHAGDMDRARRELEVFRREFRIKIAFGREPEPGEELRWLDRLNPFRRAEDSELFIEGARRAGFEAPVIHELEPYAPRVRPADIPDEGDRFQREGEIWSVAFAGRGARLAAVKGFHDLAQLLSRPGEPIHCLDLLGAPASDAGSEQLDGRARRQIEARVRELQAELEDAEARHDLGRAEKSREELEVLTEELAKALGLGGRPRKLKDPAERARTTVTWRIRSAIKKIDAAHPRLGQHLASAVKTGTFCVYSPEEPRRWQL